MPKAQVGQKVHSKLQTKASASWGSSARHFSQAGFISRGMVTLDPGDSVNRLADSVGKDKAEGDHTRYHHSADKRP
jgi:hypothetical protein